jgi:hypothetical protein
MPGPFKGKLEYLAWLIFPLYKWLFFFFLNFPAGWSQFSELLEGVVLFMEYLISN